MDIKNIYNFPNSSSYNSQQPHSDDIFNENETVLSKDIVIKQHMKKMVGGDFKSYSPITPVKACSPITSTPKSTRSSFRSSSTLRRQQGNRQLQAAVPDGAITDIQVLIFASTLCISLGASTAYSSSTRFDGPSSSCYCILQEKVFLQWQFTRGAA
uniref:Uncharacterized protein n=1 Tax=Meloidogyne hapla TaxID=6305 RepID=A0A1I8BQQ0_MELHA